MAGRAPFLERAYGAYHNREVPRENEILTHTGPATPCGEYLRRFWQPVAHSAALGDLPLPVRIMGEDLVAFRDGRGEAGLLQRHCCHRGTSLEFGRVEERGIRCCYHGWLFGVDGAILEIPNAPGKDRLRERLFQGAYPIHEHGGLVFAYMGPPDRMPPFPRFDTLDVPGYRLEPAEPLGVSNVKPCNWLQIMDNVADPVHEAFLHTTISGCQFFDKNGKPMQEMADVGELAFRRTPIGLLAQESRRVGDAIWVRCIELIYPNVAQIARAPVFPFVFENGDTERSYMPLLTRWRVPVDDEHTVEFAFVRLRDGETNPYTANEITAYRTNYGGRDYEERQRFPGDYEATVEQRAIARHRLEHLVASDRGISLFRRALLDGIRAVERGEEPEVLGAYRRAAGKIPTYGNETVIHAPARDGVDAPAELREAARRVHERVLAEPVAQRPDPRCI